MAWHKKRVQAPTQVGPPIYGQRPRDEHELRRHVVRLQVSELVSQHDMVTVITRRVCEYSWGPKDGDRSEKERSGNSLARRLVDTSLGT